MKYIYPFIIVVLMLGLIGCDGHMILNPQDDENRGPDLSFDINFLTGETVMQKQIRVGHVGFDGGQQAARQILEVYEDLPGTFEFIDVAVFNSLSVDDLRASFDVLIFPWRGSSSINADWGTRLVPFMQLGGGIIWEDELNLADLQPAISGNRGLFSGNGMYISNEVPILTDGITNNLGNGMIRFSGFNDAQFQPFISRSNGETVALWGQVGGGTIVLTGVLANYYGDKNGSVWQQNYYNLALNAILFAATDGGNVEDVYPVEITVRPGSSHNPVQINLKSRGVLPVAILSSGDFDARDVNRNTLRFGATGEEESLSTLGNGRPQCGEEDVNGNGLTDLVCHFRIQRTDFTYDSTEGILTGVTNNERKFRGTVEIKILNNDNK